MFKERTGLFWRSTKMHTDFLDNQISDLPSPNIAVKTKINEIASAVEKKDKAIHALNQEHHQLESLSEEDIGIIHRLLKNFHHVYKPLKFKLKLDELEKSRHFDNERANFDTINKGWQLVRKGFIKIIRTFKTKYNKNKRQKDDQQSFKKLLHGRTLIPFPSKNVAELKLEEKKKALEENKRKAISKADREEWENLELIEAIIILQLIRPEFEDSEHLQNVMESRNELVHKYPTHKLDDHTFKKFKLNLENACVHFKIEDDEHMMKAVAERDIADEAAIEILGEVCEINLVNPKPRYLCCEIHLKKREFKSASDNIKVALTLRPTCPAIVREAVRAYEFLEDYPTVIYICYKAKYHLNDRTVIDHSCELCKGTNAIDMKNMKSYLEDRIRESHTRIIFKQMTKESLYNENKEWKEGKPAEWLVSGMKKILENNNSEALLEGIKLLYDAAMEDFLEPTTRVFRYSVFIATYAMHLSARVGLRNLTPVKEWIDLKSLTSTEAPSNVDLSEAMKNFKIVLAKLKSRILIIGKYDNIFIGPAEFRLFFRSLCEDKNEIGKHQYNFETYMNDEHISKSNCYDRLIIAVAQFRFHFIESEDTIASLGRISDDSSDDIDDPIYFFGIEKKLILEIIDKVGSEYKSTS